MLILKGYPPRLKFLGLPPLIPHLSRNQFRAMTLNLCTPCFSRMLHHPFSSSSSLPNTHTPLPSLLFFSPSSLPNPNQSTFISTKASVSESHNETSDDTAANLFDQQLILRLAATAKDADEALLMIADNSSRNDGVVSTSDCCSIISAALNRNNPQLALSIFYAMRATFHQGYFSLQFPRVY